MNEKQGLKVVLYARFSSDLQRSESIDAQVRAMKKYCEQNRMQIIDTYVDEAKSATTDKRPSFQQMIEDSKKHIFEGIVVHKLDRFARNRYDSAMYKRTLRLNGVRVFSVLENLDDSPESIMLESLLEGMNEYYSKNLAREVMKGLKENALQCKHTGGSPPLGYYVDENKHLAIDEKEVEAVRIIFDMFSNGHSYDEIISTLNQRKFYTKKGNMFGRNSIHSILTNEKYVGTYVFNKSSSKDMYNRRNSHKYKDDNQIIKVPDGCPQLVDRETFEKVQQRLLENRHQGGMYNAKHRYLLSGFLYCGYCGKRLTGNRRYSGRNKSLSVTYRCLTHKDSCISKEYNRYFLEDFVFNQIKEHFGYKARLTSMYNKVNRYSEKSLKTLQVDLDALTNRLISVNEAILNITTAIEKGIYTDDIQGRLEELKHEKSTIEAEMSKKSQIQKIRYTDTDVSKTLNECKELMKQPTHPKNRWFLKKVISKIVLYREEILIVLNTGLSVNDDFNTEIRASRKEIYDYGRSIKNAGWKEYFKNRFIIQWW